MFFFLCFQVIYPCFLLPLRSILRGGVSQPHGAGRVGGETRCHKDWHLGDECQLRYNAMAAMVYGRTNHRKTIGKWRLYPLVMTSIAIENDPVESSWIYP